MKEELAERYALEGIYEGEIKMDDIVQNPILKPIADINSQHKNFNRMIQKELFEFDAEKQELDGMIEINPIYSETKILNRFQSMLNHVKQIIHLEDLQISNLVKAVNEMIQISIIQLSKVQQPIGIKMKKEQVKKTETEIKEKKETKKMDEEEMFFSDLIKKNVDVPKEIKVNKKNKKETLPRLPRLPKLKDKEIEKEILQKTEQLKKLEE